MPVNPAAPPPDGRDARVADRLQTLERKMRTIEQFMQGGVTSQIPVVAALPTAGRQGRILMLQSTSAIYRDTGSTWTLVA